ncbi:MAG: nickel pincer cofactor biosynthesis protein LarB [Aigarchaeota archaeon]|nr:nickel pincer cofactor biosynthesis protein LarB [Aigarchaeota archaeon]MDW8092230.1 nickel pincer cofactor biosynthesis protein LarB [Nitrososphaerota archaeon]
MRFDEVLRRLFNKEMTPEEAERILRPYWIETVEDFARLDVGREIRRDVPEIILGEKKTVDQLIKITRRMLDASGRVIISRLSREAMGKVVSSLDGDSVRIEKDEEVGILAVTKRGLEVQRLNVMVGIVTAGTADIPVARECEFVVRYMGCESFTVFDVGVAGIHRLLLAVRRIFEEDVDVVVAIAGREGALPSVLGSLVNVPIIAVPTSVGYGMGGKGVAALKAMLQSCSLGITVVNIDGGVPAGIAASLIARRISRYKEQPSKLTI